MVANQKNFFKMFDLFGVMFNFRMPDYEKYKSKTGAIVTILCVICCFLASYFDIKNFLDQDNNFTEKIFFKREKNETINLVNQNFTFAVNLPNVTTGINSNESFWSLDATYKYSNEFKKAKRV